MSPAAFATDRATVTGASGEFELPHASRAGNEVHVACEGFLPLRTTVQGGPAAGGVELALSRGGLVRIAVVGSQGEPVAGASLSLDPVAEAAERRSAHADLRGRAEARLPEGRYEVRGPGGAASAVGVTEGGTHDVRLTVD